MRVFAWIIQRAGQHVPDEHRPRAVQVDHQASSRLPAVFHSDPGTAVDACRIRGCGKLESRVTHVHGPATSEQQLLEFLWSSGTFGVGQAGVIFPAVCRQQPVHLSHPAFAVRCSRLALRCLLRPLRVSHICGRPTGCGDDLHASPPALWCAACHHRRTLHPWSPRPRLSAPVRSPQCPCPVRGQE